MTREESLNFVRDLVAEFHELRPDTAPLELESLTVVLLVEALEDRLDIRVAPREAVPENFATIAALADFVAGKTA